MDRRRQEGRHTPSPAATRSRDKKPDTTQWTDYHIIAKGEHVVLKINGVVTAELHDADPRRRDEGVLAMPVIPAEMKVQYKDLRLKRLMSMTRLGDRTRSRHPIPVAFELNVSVLTRNDVLFSSGVNSFLSRPMISAITMMPSPVGPG